MQRVTDQFGDQRLEGALLAGLAGPGLVLGRHPEHVIGDEEGGGLLTC